MSEQSGQPPADSEEGAEQEPEFRDDALSELMTGAFAATSMVTMGGEADLPAPPIWAPVEDAPKAEILDDASGSPMQIPSGPHVTIEPEIEIDAELEELERVPALARGPVTDAVVPRASDAVTVPVSGPTVAGPLGPQSVEMPASSDDYPSELGSVDDDGEGAAAISTDSGVIVTSQHAQGARLTGAYPAISSQFRSPSPQREKSVMAWTIGAAVLAGLVVVGIVVISSGSDPLPAAAPTESEQAEAVIAPTSTPTQNRPDPPDAPALEDQQAEVQTALDPPREDASLAEADDPKQAYAAALARYEAAPTNPGLLELTLTACALEMGPEARAAFHKLIGGELRSKALVKCREAGVDITSKAEGYTGPEIATQARAALDKGDAKEALVLAKQSNRTQRNLEALQLIVLAHCELKHKKSAKKMLRHVPEKHRRGLIRDCKSRGVRLK